MKATLKISSCATWSEATKISNALESRDLEHSIFPDSDKFFLVWAEVEYPRPQSNCPTKLIET